MVTIEKLHFHYRQRKAHIPVINIPKLELPPNRKLMLFGESGCGKTTLLNLIAGILLPDSGTIRFNDRTINTLADRDRRLYRLNNIGYILQDFSLIPHLKMRDNIKLPFYINPDFHWEDHHRTNLVELTQQLRIERLLLKYPDQLSIGEKQRACLCRALITEPKLILADEPTANLDEENRDEVLHILDRYIQKHQATLMMVCHDKGIRDWFDELIPFKEVNRV